MIIDAIRLYHVAMPLIEPWRTAYGEDPAIESVLVEMCSDGASAWSECSPLAAPCYSPEWAGGVFALLKKWLAPAMVGPNLASSADVQQAMGHIKGNPFAKAAMDIGWWVLDAQLRGVPLYRALGGQPRRVAVGADFGITDSIDHLLEQIQQAVDARVARIKLKFRPGWDLPMLTAVRERFADATIHIDCNSGYTLADAPLFEALDAFNLAMIEQPLGHDDLIDHARLQQRIQTPICLDESICGPERMRQAIELGACRFVNIKPGRVGGLTPALSIYEQAQQAGLGIWVGGMLESAVGARVCTALAMLDAFNYPPDIFPSRRWYVSDLARPEVELISGENGAPSVQPLESPGIGTVPDPEQLRRCCLQEALVTT